MELNATEIQVFVSCPRDVQAEKNIVKKVCKRINDNQRDIGCNIFLVFRDFTEIIGAMGTRPQQIINDSIKDYNIYLGIMHMRFGTPTGELNNNTGEFFESGTEEEFVLASEKNQIGKEPGSIYFFFKAQKGAKNFAESEQAGKVLRFKETLISTNKNWVNDFTSRITFERTITDLLTRITGKLCIDKTTQIKQAILEENTFVSTVSIDFSQFVPNFPKLPHYIYRSISQTEKIVNQKTALFDLDENKIELKDILLKEKRIALLGNAGSGKSIELQQTAIYFQNPDTPYIPIYKRFNTYTDQDIELFLPVEWKKIDQNVLIIFFDGLDEVQPQNFDTAVRKLIAFTESYPLLRIVVSCRTNFYELPGQSFSGTLTGFSAYVLNPISLAEVKNYVQTCHNFNWDAFIREIYSESYLDLLQKPFFLSILINYYLEHGNFTGGRLRIIEDSILSMIVFDQEHFKSVDIPKSKRSIINLLEKVAFVMEIMGRNFITDEELETILTTQEEIKRIKHFSAFARNIQKDVWMFEHNNIQEFLASRILGRQSFEKLKKIITFTPGHYKIKPTWINTLSFFISTSDSTVLINRLIDWMVNKDYEVLVKFEPDRVNKETRIKVFRKIYNFYKEKNIWLSSNKFNGTELGRFSAFPETIDFLLNEIDEKKNSRVAKLNALSVLGNFNLSDFDAAYFERIKIILLNALDSKHSDSYFIHDILYVLADLKITDPRTIEYCVNKYANNINQYIRTGLYKLLNSSSEYEKHVNIFLDGLNLKDIKAPVGKRDSTSLSSESWQLNEGLIKMKSSAALKNILSHLKLREDRRILEKYNYHDVIAAIIKNTFDAFSEDRSLFNDIYEILVTAGRDYDQQYVRMLLPFYNGTGTKWETFILLWNDKNVRDYEKRLILELLLDKNIVKQFLDDYTKRNFSNKDAEMMHQLLQGAFPHDHPEFNLVTDFEIFVNGVSDLKLQKREFIDWQAIHKKRAQNSFNILFDQQALIDEIKNIFSAIGQDELSFNELWEFKKDHTKLIDDHFIGSAIELLRDFTTSKRTVSLSKIEAWLRSDKFAEYQIEEIYGMLHDSRHKLLIVDKTQINFITEWCLKEADKIDIEKAIKHNDENTSISVNRSAIHLWFFVKRFKIALPEKKMLEFTLFYPYENNNDSDRSETIIQLESFVSKEKIKDKVKANIASRIKNSFVWLSNTTYAIENKIEKAFPHILSDLKTSTIHDRDRDEILKLYFKKTRNFTKLQEIVNSVQQDDFRWDVINILIENEQQHKFLLQYLKKVMNNEYEFESRMKAGNYLMKLNSLDGLAFVAGQILEQKNPLFDFRHHLSSISSIKTPEAIPILLELLTLSKQPEFQKDKFNSLESLVFDPFYSIGIQSEEAFLLVKEALEQFVVQNKATIPNIDFIHFNIKKIEDQLYMKKSQAYSIDQAIIEFKKINT